MNNAPNYQVRVHYPKEIFGVFLGNETQCDRLRMVWLSCHGATAADEEYLGPMRYTPTQGFPAKFTEVHVIH